MAVTAVAASKVHGLKVDLQVAEKCPWRSRRGCIKGPE
jgi:hypothetical protein